jgi:hypothetical protein
MTGVPSIPTTRSRDFWQEWSAQGIENRTGELDAHALDENDPITSCRLGPNANLPLNTS